MQRRRALTTIAAALLAAGMPAAARAAITPAEAERTIRIGLTPVFLDNQVGFLKEWRRFLEERLERSVEFVQRGSYREIVDLIRQDKIHFAWLCGFPFVRNRSRMRLLAVPVYGGQPLYQSYLIVPERDTATRSIFELRGRVFAFSDPDSNSGFLYPQYQLKAAQENPAAFFRRSFFTYGHRNVVEAVAARVAHAGAVDGYVWETLRLTHPELSRRTRIADRSPHFGFPPLVAAPGVRPGAMTAMQTVLLGMHQSPAGQALLQRLNLDRFEAGRLDLFDSIERMVRVVEST